MMIPMMMRKKITRSEEIINDNDNMDIGNSNDDNETVKREKKIH